MVLGFVVYSIVNSYTGKFSPGDCVKNIKDDYIWIVNNYSNGKYYLMGWQGTSWGNRVEMEKSVLESVDYPMEIAKYSKTICPSFKK